MSEQYRDSIRLFAVDTVAATSGGQACFSVLYLGMFSDERVDMSVEDLIAIYVSDFEDTHEIITTEVVLTDYGWQVGLITMQGINPQGNLTTNTETVMLFQTDTNYVELTYITFDPERDHWELLAPIMLSISPITP